MAVDTRHFARFVRTSFPEQTIAAFMTRQAGPIFFLHAVLGVFGESDRDRVFTAARLNVGLTRTMTGFTSEFFFFIFRSSERLAHHRALEVLSLIRVTRNAGFTADVSRARLRT